MVAGLVPVVLQGEGGRPSDVNRAPEFPGPCGKATGTFTIGAAMAHVKTGPARVKASLLYHKNFLKITFISFCFFLFLALKKIEIVWLFLIKALEFLRCDMY